MNRGRKIRSPLVSVIIPNYNHAKYLEHRIQSVLNQTYQLFEVIILDDCSPDEGASKKVIERYRSNSHVSQIVYNDTNSGSTFNQWERGISLAKGELIWIAESDDYCDEQLLEKLVNCFVARKNIVLAYSSSTIVDDNGVVFCPSGSDTRVYSGEAYIRRYLSLGNMIANASSAVFKKSAALNVPSDYKCYSGAGDYLFWVYIAAQGDVAFVREPHNFFRRHSGTVTDARSFDGTNLYAEYEILRRITDLVHISKLRMRYVKAYHARRIYYARFNSEETRNNLKELWSCEESRSLWNRFILKVGTVMSERFNLYV